MTTYDETLAVAAEINRAPGGYQTRTSAERPAVIAVKGGKQTGWLIMSVARAKERFHLERPGPDPGPAPEPEPALKPTAAARPAPKPAWAQPAVTPPRRPGAR